MFEPLDGILAIMRVPEFWVAAIALNAVFGFLIIAINKLTRR